MEVWVDGQLSAALSPVALRLHLGASPGVASLAGFVRAAWCRPLSRLVSCPNHTPLIGYSLLLNEIHVTSTLQHRTAVLVYPL